MPEYRENQKKIYKEKIDQLVGKMPQSIYRYVVGIESTISPHTLYEYLSCDYVFLQFLHEKKYPNIKIKDIDYKHLDRLVYDDFDDFLHMIYSRNLNDLKPEKANRTRNHYLSALRSWFGFLYDRDKLSKNVITKIKVSKVPDKEFVVKLDEGQEKRLIQEVNSGSSLTKQQNAYRAKYRFMETRDQMIITLLLRTGLRVSELVALDEDHIFFPGHCFSVQRKRDKPDIVMLDDETEAMLKDYLAEKNALPFDKDDQAVFITLVGEYKGKRMTVRSVQRMVKKYASAGVPEIGSCITPHRLRATFATDLLHASDNNVKLVQEAMAHKNIETTMVYLGQDTQDKRANRNLLISDREEKWDENQKKF